MYHKSPILLFIFNLSFSFFLVSPVYPVKYKALYFSGVNSKSLSRILDLSPTRVYKGTSRIVAPEGEDFVFGELEPDIRLPNVFVIRSLKMEPFGTAFMLGLVLSPSELPDSISTGTIS